MMNYLKPYANIHRERERKEVRILLHLEPSHYTCIENIISFFNWNIYKLKNITFISQKVWSNQNMSIQNNGLKRYTPIVSQKTISTSIMLQTCFTSKRVSFEWICTFDNTIDCMTNSTWFLFPSKFGNNLFTKK